MKELKKTKDSFYNFMWMDNSHDIKMQLHQLIDSIEDEHTLHLLKEDLVEFLADTEAPDELTAEQLQDLDESIEEVARGEVITHEEFLSNMKQWLSR